MISVQFNSWLRLLQDVHIIHHANLGNFNATKRVAIAPKSGIAITQEWLAMVLSMLAVLEISFGWARRSLKPLPLTTMLV